jgi:5-methylcytosine-specific restriction endonuclease McrA
VTIIEGIQICIPQWSGRADAVIQRMESLLRRRYRLQVSRRAFIRDWRRLRIALFLTRDYQELRERCKRESKGMCEFCKVRGGEHMHHVRPVVFEPRQALVRENVKWCCVSCHPDADRDAREQAMARKQDQAR